MSDGYVLSEGAYPVVFDERDLDAPFWEGTRNEELRLQQCLNCERFQWGPGVICHHCQSFVLRFQAIAPVGTIYSWQRSWHTGHPSLVDSVPYVVVFVEPDDALGIYIIGNLVGDPTAPVEIGARVEGIFEHHDDYTLVQWKVSPEAVSST
jgi:uncharacterized OB-fold protein